MQQLIAVSLESRMPVVDYTYANITEAEKYQIMKREVMRVGQIRHPHLAAFVGCANHLPYLASLRWRPACIHVPASRTAATPRRARSNG